MENTNDKLSNEEKLLELYKELGADVRHFDRHVYIGSVYIFLAVISKAAK